MNIKAIRYGVMHSRYSTFLLIIIGMVSKTLFGCEIQAIALAAINRWGHLGTQYRSSFL